MSVRLTSHYESAGEAATIYLAGTITTGDELALRNLFFAIPPSVRILRVDLGALVQFDVDTIDTIRTALIQWRELRGGVFHLSAQPHRRYRRAAEHLIAEAAAL